ncbi:uncharacterized protein LOC114323554 [Camellia sinensis]|uniref:uncharacterized protein LOC114323554 n=1 Tax=Camellia sinensis TaxID=4442 RepID=UPI0010362992|nr:uncharacterized protein LOC114323554 [Camellia sinensis]
MIKARTVKTIAASANNQSLNPTFIIAISALKKCASMSIPALKFHFNWITIPFTLSTCFSFLKKSVEPTFAMLVAAIVMEPSPTSVDRAFLDVNCALLTKNNNNKRQYHHQKKKIQFQFQQPQLPNHPHPLILCYKDKNLTYKCTCCSLTIDGDWLYVCLQCKGLLHHSCAELPSKIETHFTPLILFCSNLDQAFMTESSSAASVARGGTISPTIVISASLL